MKRWIVYLFTGLIGVCVCLFWRPGWLPFSWALTAFGFTGVVSVWCLYKAMEEYRNTGVQPGPDYVSLHGETKRLFELSDKALSLYRIKREIEVCGLTRELFLTVGETRIKVEHGNETATLGYLDECLDNITDEYYKQLVVLCLLWKHGFNGPLPFPTGYCDDDFLIDSSKKKIRQSNDCLTRDKREGVPDADSDGEDIRQQDDGLYNGNEYEDDDEYDDDGYDESNEDDDENRITDDGTLYWFVCTERENKLHIIGKLAKEQADAVYNEEQAKGGDVYAPVRTTWTGICKRHGTTLDDMRIMRKESDNNG